jgi:hypothetical protein
MGAEADNPRVAEEADGEWVSVSYPCHAFNKVDSLDKSALVVRFPYWGRVPISPNFGFSPQSGVRLDS